MSGNNNHGIGLGVVFVFVVIWMAVVFVYAVVAFIALVLSLMAVFALFHPIRLGSISLDAGEAKAFLLRGVLGAVAVPLFVMFAEGMFGFRLRPDFWVHTAVIGYCLGSLGFEVWQAQQNEAAQQAQQQGAMQALMPPEPARPVRTIDVAPTVPTAPAAEHAPRPAFRVASWDDEEELRK